MEIPRKNRVKKNVSVSVDVDSYLKELVQRKINASEAIDQAVKATPEFKKFMKEKKDANT